MKESSPFQIVLLIVFGFMIVIAVAIFSSGAGSQSEVVFLGNVVVWGTLPEEVVNKSISDIQARDKTVTIAYVEKDKNTFDTVLIEALASGTGPDVILLPHDLILRHSNKIFKVPYTSMTERNFKDRFIEEGELYLSRDGIFALPVSIDPMIMYWNRDIFSKFGLSRPPISWDEFYTLAPTITVTDRASSDIISSTIAFGEFRNVTHAKDILSLLILQAGNKIIVNTPTSSSGYGSVLSKGLDKNIPPADAALRFFTEFSNTAKTIYSWNGALPSSKDMFLSGDLAVYFGFASELQEIKKKNPHLNFDIAEVPQASAPEGINVRKTTYGRMQGAAILKSTKNIPASFNAVVLLSGKESAAILSSGLGLPPTRRELLAERPTGEYLPLFYQSALISRAWLDPNPESTENIFMNMVDNIVSGRSKVSESVSNASKILDQLLK